MKKNILIVIEAVLILLAVISFVGLYRDNTTKVETIKENKIEIEELKYNLELQDNGNNTTDIAEKNEVYQFSFCLLFKLQRR